MKLIYNGCRGFCITPLNRGAPLSFNGNYSSGFPEVELFNGNEFCGISNETVVDVDATMNSLGAEIITGGMINIVSQGLVRIPKQKLTCKLADYNKWIRPTKNGLWKVQKCRTKKSVGVIQLVAEDYVEVAL